MLTYQRVVVDILLRLSSLTEQAADGKDQKSTAPNPPHHRITGYSGNPYGCCGHAMGEGCRKNREKSLAG